MSTDKEVAISVVIPVYNEEEVLPELYRRLTRTMKDIGQTYEVIFVDDGSKDRSFEILKTLRQQDEHLRIIKFTRNFGQHPAIMAGFNNCVGEAVVLMDADLQNPPEEIPKLLERFREGYDIVYGIRGERKDSFYRKIGSGLAKWLMCKILNLDLALRVLTLVEHVVRKELKSAGETLSGLYTGNPKRQTARPTTERLLKAFRSIYLNFVHLPNQAIRHVTPLSALQKRVLVLLGIDPMIYEGLMSFFDTS